MLPFLSISSKAIIICETILKIILEKDTVTDRHGFAIYYICNFSTDKFWINSLPARSRRCRSGHKFIFSVSFFVKKIIDFPFGLPLELQRNRDTIRCHSMLGSQVPGHRPKQRACLVHCFQTYGVTRTQLGGAI